MREILFRGKRKDNGEWVYGFYCPACFGFFPCSPAIISKELMDSGCWKPEEVIPETVGQYTGLTDKNGKKIFEGDIVKGLFVFGEISSVVIFKYGSFGIEWNIDEIKVLDPFLGLRNIECEVIGNIHDNPELLKGGDESDT